jgi:hypothetical protein
MPIGMQAMALVLKTNTLSSHEPYFYSQLQHGKSILFTENSPRLTFFQLEANTMRQKFYFVHSLD